MLVWATVGSGAATPLVYQRYVDGGWQEAQALPGGEKGGLTALGMNGSVHGGGIVGRARPKRQHHHHPVGPFLLTPPRA